MTVVTSLERDHIPGVWSPCMNIKRYRLVTVTKRRGGDDPNFRSERQECFGRFFPR